MLIRDKKLVGLSLVRDDNGKYVGCYNNVNNSVDYFKEPVHNLYNLMKNFAVHFSDWQDEGFGIYSNHTYQGIATLIIRDKHMHENNAMRVIHENSMKMYPEIRDKFISYCRDRLRQTEYIHVQINVNNKDYHYSIDKYGNFIRICDVKGFLMKHPYYPNLSYVPQIFYRELQLIEESMARKHDVGLDFCLKLATDMSDEEILDFQDRFRDEMKTFVFDKTSKEHLECLIKYMKEKTPENKHFNVINLLYSTHGYEYREIDANPNSYCAKYTHGMKRELMDLIEEDKDCASIINTNIIPRQDRNKMIKEDGDLIKSLRYIYHEDVDIAYLEDYINKDINNLKYVNVAALMKKDVEYTCEVLNKYIEANLDCNNESIVDKILFKYSMCIRETVIKQCIDKFPINKLYLLARIKDSGKYIPCLINRLNGEILQATDRELKKSVGKLTDLIRDKYSIEFKDKGENVEVVFLDNASGEYIIDMEEPNLSSKLGDLDRDKLFEVYWDDCAYDNYFEQNEKFAESYSKQLKMIFG